MNFRPTNIEKGEGGEIFPFQANRSNNYVTDCSTILVLISRNVIYLYNEKHISFLVGVIPFLVGGFKFLVGSH